MKRRSIAEQKEKEQLNLKKGKKKKEHAIKEMTDEIKIGKTEEKRNTQRKEETKEYENRQ